MSTSSWSAPARAGPGGGAPGGSGARRAAGLGARPADGGRTLRRRRPGVIRGLLLTALVAIPFGLLAAALLRRPLEAAMLLLIVSGMQLILDPFGTAARSF